MLYDGGIIFNCAQSKFHLVHPTVFPHNSFQLLKVWCNSLFITCLFFFFLQDSSICFALSMRVDWKQYLITSFGLLYPDSSRMVFFSWSPVEAQRGCSNLDLNMIRSRAIWTSALDPILTSMYQSPGTMLYASSNVFLWPLHFLLHCVSSNRMQTLGLHLIKSRT